MSSAPKAIFLMRLGKSPAETMPNAKHINDVAINSEENPVKMRPVAIEQLPHFERNGGVFRGQLAASGEVRKGSNGFFQPHKPSQPGLSGMLR